MRVRGAAAIGVAAANALADHLAAAEGRSGGRKDLLAEARRAARRLDAARPTAVPLHNALGWVLRAVAAEGSAAAARDAADRVARQAAASRVAVARRGARRIPKGAVVLTHCHSTTAVAVLAEGHRTGRVREVFATETRPFRQGLLTAAGLASAGVPCTLVVDSAVEHLLATRGIDAVVVGADTVAADGSLYNKVGTAGTAALAAGHRVPFLSAAGVAKFTRRRPAQVPVEERAAAEVFSPRDIPLGVRVLNPVFDRTPARRVTAYLTEAGPLSPARAVARARPLLPPEAVWG
jgi:ribose 1,5-bisphosphate isomerase